MKRRVKAESRGFKSGRYRLLDSIRGFSVVSMVLYHAMYDAVAIYGADVDWYFDTPGYIWQQSICWTFIIISGVCWSMGRSPLRRGLLLSACGLAVTAVTLVFMPAQLIVMGVISLLGLSMLLMIPLSKAAKGSPAVWFWLSAALFFITRGVNRGYFGFEGLILSRVPSALYSVPGGFILGFPHAGFYSSDYFSLLPWFFLFAAGHFLWRCIGPRLKDAPLMYKDIPLLGPIGRKSLIIYAVHQPALIAVFELISPLLGS